MKHDSARACAESSCQGEVRVTRLSGGPSIKGKVVDIRSGGAHLILDDPLNTGEIIRLILPARPDEVVHSGRMMIGRVLCSGGTPGRHNVGIGFGWRTDGKSKPRPSHRESGLWSWVRFLREKDAVIR